MQVEINTADQSGTPVVVLSIDEHVTVFQAEHAVDVGNALIKAGLAHLNPIQEQA